MYKNIIYSTLESFDAPTRVSGRVTAELEMAIPGKFSCKVGTPLKKEEFHKAFIAEGYEIVVDTHGTLLWKNQEYEKRPILILTSENVNREYLDYLTDRHISWIACGKERI